MTTRWLILGTVLLSSCSLLPSSDRDDEPLIGTRWVLASAFGPGGSFTVRDDRNFLVFNEDGTTTGVADCNACQGQYATDGDSINVVFACTEKACGDGSHGGAFQEGVLRARRYTIDGNRLSFHNEEDGGIVLVAR